MSWRSLIGLYLASLPAVALYLFLQLPRPPFRPVATKRSRKLLIILLVYGALDATVVGALLAVLPAFVIAPSLVALVALSEKSVRAIPEIPLTKFLSLGFTVVFDRLVDELSDHKGQWVLRWADTLDTALMSGSRDCFLRVYDSLSDWWAARGLDDAHLRAAADLRQLAIDAETLARQQGDARALFRAESDQRQQFLALLRIAYDWRLGTQLRRVLAKAEHPTESPVAERPRLLRELRRLLGLPDPDPAPSSNVTRISRN